MISNLNACNNYLLISVGKTKNYILQTKREFEMLQICIYGQYFTQKDKS